VPGRALRAVAVPRRAAAGRPGQRGTGAGGRAPLPRAPGPPDLHRPVHPGGGGSAAVAGHGERDDVGHGGGGAGHGLRSGGDGEADGPVGYRSGPAARRGIALHDGLPHHGRHLCQPLLRPLQHGRVAPADAVDRAGLRQGQPPAGARGRPHLRAEGRGPAAGGARGAALGQDLASAAAGHRPLPVRRRRAGPPQRADGRRRDLPHRVPHGDRDLHFRRRRRRRRDPALHGAGAHPPAGRGYPRGAPSARLHGRARARPARRPRRHHRPRRHRRHRDGEHEQGDRARPRQRPHRGGRPARGRPSPCSTPWGSPTRPTPPTASTCGPTAPQPSSSRSPAPARRSPPRPSCPSR